ncbi:SGNH/GDSL hydrolase family protein [Actinomadura miaoliensis]|uniref:SGNH/GDSL hydrolase family protein n=1 Tax=Actinomadura miaoliensis TaxID=430685 RepID=A0ABP7WGG9_9ACTN
MTSRRARRGAAIATLCLGSLLATGCGAFSEPSRPNAAAPAAPSASSVPRAPVVMFLGDSYTVGERGTLVETAYASAAARLLGWQVIVGGRGGTGFVQGGAGRTPFGVMFESQLGWRPAPDLLIISGGHNDARVRDVQVGPPARDLLVRARQRWPGTRIALIGPIWGSDTPPPAALAVRDQLRGVAQQLGVPFIDPIAERWITGDRSEGTGNAAVFIKKDGVHPTPEGHRYIAARLVENLRRLHLAHPSRATA